MRMGDLHAGAQPTREARYSKDTFLISDRFCVSVDILKVIVETYPAACTEHEVMDHVSQFQWRMDNIPEVQSSVSLASVAKAVNAGYNEGNLSGKRYLQWRFSHYATSRVETSSGLLNGDCSVMPVIIFMEDHKAESIERSGYGEEYGAEFGTDSVIPTGIRTNWVMAATNESVSKAQTPMMLYVYGAVIVLCLLSFRSLRATIAVVLPLYIVSTLAQALMVGLEIGLTVSTLPVIALGVGIGVDYGIYILSSMMTQLKQGVHLSEAYRNALAERGSAVLFTGITLAVGVSTWIFSALISS